MGPKGRAQLVAGEPLVLVVVPGLWLGDQKFADTWRSETVILKLMLMQAFMIGL